MLPALRYEGALRRRGRQLRRLGEAAVRSQTWGGPVVPAFWWDGHPNFGDDLTPMLLPRYGMVALHRSPRAAQLIGVGSLLEFVSSDYAGAIWGTGLMHDAAHALPAATVLAVRGPLTAERIGMHTEPAYGDPGLLVARHVPRPVGDGRIAVVPHGHHRSHPRLHRLIRQAGDEARTVDVHRRALPAVRDIAAARVVLTTSLHGLITADAYGIPAVWTTLAPALGGGDFKFRDYEAAVTPGRTRYRPFDTADSLSDLVAGAWSPDPHRVAHLISGLENALSTIAHGDIGLRPFPRSLPSAFRQR